MFTPNDRYRNSNGQVEDPLFTQTISVGGSRLKAETDVAVIPERSVPIPTVMTLTPPPSSRMAPRNESAPTVETPASRLAGRIFIAATPASSHEATSGILDLCCLDHALVDFVFS